MFADLPQISALFCSFSFYSAFLNLLCLTLLYSAFSRFTLSSFKKKLSLHIKMILFIDFLTWLFVFCLEFEMESHVSLPSAFSLLLSAYSEIITVGVNFNITVGVCFLSETCQCITNNKNLNKTFTFKFKWELQLNSFSLLNWYAFVFSLVVFVFPVTVFYLLSDLFALLSSPVV